MCVCVCVCVWVGTNYCVGAHVQYIININEEIPVINDAC